MTGKTWDEPANFAETLNDELKNAQWQPDRHIVMEGDVAVEWRKVVYASDCELCTMCEEPVCAYCETHYADCECPGPHSDESEWEFDTFFGAEYARPCCAITARSSTTTERRRCLKAEL